MGFYKSLDYPAGMVIYSLIFKFLFVLRVCLAPKLISQFKVKSEVPSF